MSVIVRDVGGWRGPADDRVVLRADERRVRRKRLVAQGGTEVMLDFEHARTLHSGEALETDGRLVEIVGAEEPLLALTVAGRLTLAELAWHLGNRHLAAQIETDRILVARDPVIRRMVEGLGAEVEEIEEAFDPVHGAYHDHER